jgi:large subunit ribosomal protein L21
MYAIVRTGGKQYRVEAGRSLEVDRLPGQEGDTVELGDVLLIAGDGEVTVGTPTIEGARVMAGIEAQGKAPKIVVFNYKNKVRSRKKSGHRQQYTRLAVREILRAGEEATEVIKVPADGDLDTEEEAAEAIVAMGRKTRVATAKPPKAPAPKRPARAPARAEKAPAKATARATASKPSAKPKAPVRAKAKTETEKKPARRLPLRRKKETE